MKNLVKFAVLLFALTFTFFSCKNASITKRHYNKGYYVSHSHKHGKIKADPKVKAPAANTEAIVTKPKLNPENKIEAEILASAETKKAESSEEIADRTSGETRNLKKSEHGAFPYSEKIVSLKNKIHVKPIPSGLLESARDSNALSLIWLLIVVLLVVYLLGILFEGFGLGGLIHILGVVIVVLLILWLVRLI